MAVSEPGMTIAEQIYTRTPRNGLAKCNFKLSASKTVINPKSTVILVWIWDSGTLQASPRRIAPLASCNKPEKVGRLKSFIGAYKVLARVTLSSTITTGHCVAGRQSHERINWSDDLLAFFHHAQ